MLRTLWDLCRYLSPEGEEQTRRDLYGQLLRFSRRDCPGGYRKVRIPKHSGGIRVLWVPCPALRRIQRELLRLLENAPLPPCATAYRKGVTLAANAAPHAGHPLVVKTDLKDFFDSVPFPAVFRAIDGALRRSPAFGPDIREHPGRWYNAPLSFYLARLCTYRGTLPQGAPTSPLLSNLAFSPLDSIISEHCGSRGISYTRYSDDMTFSGSFSPEALLAFLHGLLGRSGYRLNREKTSVLGPGRRHLITGVTVSEKLSAGTRYKRALRQEFYYIGRFGLWEHLLRRYPGQEPDPYRYLMSLLGRVCFVLQLEPNNLEFQGYRRDCLMLRTLVF